MGLGDTVLVPLISPASGAWLGRLAAMIAIPDDGEVVPLSVLTPDADDKTSAAARDAVDAAVAAAVAHGARCHGEVLHGRSVATTVLDAVDSNSATLVMMGWQGRSTKQNVFGELIDSVMGRSSVPLAVVRSAAEPFDRVLLPVSDDHLIASGFRGVSLGASLARRVGLGSSASLVVVHTGPGPAALPEDVRSLSGPVLRMDGTVAEVVGRVARPSDIVIAPVAPTVDGLRQATTHLAWATPASWQLVAIDVGPVAKVDVVSAVEDAGLLIEPVPDPEVDTPHEVEVRVVQDLGVTDPSDQVRASLSRIGDVVRLDHIVEDDRQVTTGRVRIMAVTSGAALAAVMMELDEVRPLIAPRELGYGLVTD